MMRVNADIYQQIVKDVERGKKINAIKKLRAATHSGLKEAKEAIERMQHEKNLGNYPHAAAKAERILCGPIVRRLVMDYGTGEFEVDLETMELKVLMDMQTIGLDACGDVLELVGILKAYSYGKKVEVLDASR
tara:strand:- start:107 stop:505 length:399 start_codon:yes stop_codon:yes gene_type:complete